MKRIQLLLAFILLYFAAFAAEISPGNTYQINSVYSGGKSLSVRHSSLNNKADVVTWTETDVNSQKWKLEQADGNFFFLTNAYSGKALHYSALRPKPGDRIEQDLNDKSGYFQWEFVPVNNPAYPDTYFIRFSMTSTDNYLYLEQADDIDGSVVKVQLKNATADSIRQMWKVQQAEAIPNQVTPALREEMMNGWKDYYYKPAAVGSVIGNGGWWGDAEMIETVLDAFETTGDPKYKDMFTQLYINFISRNKSDWSYNEYNDDIAWMVLAAVRASLMFGDSRYLSVAKNNFDKMYARALLPSGMLRWKQTPLNNQGTNSCINGPAEVAACYLAIATGDDSYNEKAKNLYALQRKYLYDPVNGKVFDAGNWNNTTFTVANYWVSTYNQGTFLGAALMLYNRYGDVMYKNDALKIVEWTKKDLCDLNGVVKVCGSGNDLQGFKGILMRYLRRYIVDLAKPDAVDWMQRNALHAFNNRNSKRISWTAWWEKSTENFIFSDGYNYVNQPFGASTALSAVFNAPLDKNLIIKNAYQNIEAENFDYLKGVLVENNAEAQNGNLIGNVLNNYHTVYNNVDFGVETAIRASLRVLGGTAAGSVEIRLGSSTGQLLGTAIIPADNPGGWTTVTCDITNAPVGMRNIVLVYLGGGYKVDNFQFYHSGSGLNQNKKQVNLQIFPNPATETISVDSKVSGSINIYNSEGKLVYSDKISQGNNVIDIRNYTSGYYLVKIHSQNEIFSNIFLKK